MKSKQSTKKKVSTSKKGTQGAKRDNSKQPVPRKPSAHKESKGSKVGTSVSKQHSKQIEQAESVNLDQLSAQLDNEEMKQEEHAEGEYHDIKSPNKADRKTNKANSSLKSDHIEKVDFEQVKHQIEEEAFQSSREIRHTFKETLPPKDQKDEDLGAQKGLEGTKTLGPEHMKQLSEGEPEESKEENQENQQQIDKQFTIGAAIPQPAPDQEVTQVQKLNVDFGLDMALDAMVEDKDAPPIMNDEIQIGFDDDAEHNIKIKETGETQGMNLGEMKEDIKSLANTDKLPGNQASDLFYGDSNHDKYSAGDNLIKKQSLVESLPELKYLDTADAMRDSISQVRETWQHIKDEGSLDSFGTEIFTNFFLKDASYKTMFSFKDKNDWFKSEELKEHQQKVVDAIGYSIDNVHQLANLKTFLQQLGKTHMDLGVEKFHYNHFYEAVMLSVETHLKDRFTQSVHDSWKSVLQLVFSLMISDNYDMLDESKISMIQMSWDIAHSNEFFGLQLFKALFSIDGKLLSHFSFSEERDLYISDSFSEHKKKVTNAINTLIHHLDSQDQLQGYIQKLGQIHSTFKLTEYEFEVFGQALISTLKSNLGQKMTSEIEKAWQAAYKQISAGILYEMQHDHQQEGMIDLEATKSRPSKIKQTAYRSQDDIAERAESIELPPLDDHVPERSQAEQNRMLGRDDASDFDNIGINKEESIYQEMSVHQFEQQSQSNKDEILDEVEALTENIKSQFGGKKSRFEMDKDSDASAVVHMKEQYIQKFRKEVDFHHKIAYRFEKAYRLRKKQIEGFNLLNVEIIECISEHSGYLASDPMVFFYCLFFCIYFKNSALVDFFRNLIEKTRQNEKTDKLLEYIDSYGIDRLRTVGEQINSIVYHMVFYQAIDDDLRIVYSQILRQLRFIQLRDKDALQLLKQRDYELISASFDKYTTKINLTFFFKKAFPMKSSTYRRYNRAYFEEIVINNDVEPRVARNYREKFLVSAEDIYNVFEMYCKEDYDEQFLGTKKDNITHKQFVDLFIISLRNDSFKIATIIYLMFLNHGQDIDQKMMDIILSTVRESPRYHEIKLFFIHEHFDILTIQQMNQLLDIYQDILSRQNAKENPMISQFNTIKVTLLIYRICWKIEEKQIYSLITKCSLLQTYLINSLSKYFEYQNNILVLHKFMSEPILHMTERKDSLDIMYEMNMKELLQHPVVVEVINLVYEGEYSISSTSLSLSRTFLCMLDMDIFDQKSICQRMIQNITNFGDTDNKKQSSLMYNIWKQSILQREQDEMAFTIIINLLLIMFAVWVNQIHNQSYVDIMSIFGSDYFGETMILLTSDSTKLADYCQREVDSFLLENSIIGYFRTFILIQTIGMTTSIFQRLITVKFKDNVTLDIMQVALEASIVINGIFFVVSINTDQRNALISDFCGSKIYISDQDKDVVDYIYTLRHPSEGQTSFKLVLSVLIVQSSIAILYMLQRTQYLGQTIMMLTFMISEILRFFATFGIVMVIFIIVGGMLKSDLKYDGEYSYWRSFIDLYKTFNGAKVLSEFQVPLGQAYITLYMYIFQIFLMSLLVAMFINKQTTVMRNLDAYRRFNIIRLKNSEQYDQYIGGITITFFPINILMIPFVLPVIALRNPRISDFALKIQYSVMILLYLIVTSFLVIPMMPILYLKQIFNSMFIARTHKREDYRGQNLNQLLTSIFLGPMIVLISMLVDILIFPSILLMSNEEFEHKYQMSQEKLSRPQMNRVLTLFRQKFSNTDKKLRDEMITLEQLMLMHRNFFKIIDNLHDLTCKGIKDYKKALSIVQDYNMSKILSAKFSIPDKGGEFRKGRCEMELLFNVQTDIILYNYIDVLLRKKNMGILEQDMLKRQKERMSISEDDQDNQSKKLDESFELNQTKQIGEEEGMLPTEFGPDGVILKRNHSDLMNNFFIDLVSKSYLDTANSLSNDQSKISQLRQQELETELTKRQEEWKQKTINILEKYTRKYVRIARWQVNPDEFTDNKQDFTKGKSIRQQVIPEVQKKKSTVSSTNSEEKQANSLDNEQDVMHQETHDFKPKKKRTSKYE